jgi:signal transduction histidine kinase
MDPLTRIKWPVALATLFLVLLGWYLLYTQQIVQALRTDAETLTEIFAQVQEGLTTQEEFGEENALFRLQGIVLETGVPIVVTVPRQGPSGGDSVFTVENLPFEADLSTSRGQEQVLNYVARLDARNPPVGDPGTMHLHFGDTAEIRRLRWIPWLQAAGLLLTVAVGFTVIRAQRRAESERAWTAMARELAHQLGTPISSLQGWLEVLRLPPDERPGELGRDEVAGAIQEDLVRLERISRRFELIGREPELQPLELRRVVGDLEGYLTTRLPRLGSGVSLDVRVPPDLPPVKGNEVLLVWALENLVKNALDALAGTGGTISIHASAAEPDWVVLEVRDTGPGVDPSVRDRIFEPGVSTKSGGWGVGLALARRIVEGVHGGRIELVDGRARGAVFELRLPAAG